MGQRGRPKKENQQTQNNLSINNTVNNEKKTSNSKAPPYSIQQVENKWSKLFSSNSSASNGFMNNFFMNSGSMFINDPYLLNTRIKQLKTMSGFLDRDEIENALLAPEFNEMGLRTATHSMLNMNYPLYKLQMLYEGILTYHSYIFPKYVPKSEMNTPRFQSDDKLMDMWLKKLNPEKQLRRMTAEIIAEGKRAYYLRQSLESKTGKEQVDYVHWQELPSDWYRIIKKSTNSHYVIAFNFAYFWMAGTSLGQFPQYFAETYNELMGVTIRDENNNVIAIDTVKTPKDVVVEYNANTMKWCYWKELPDDECFVFSFDESHALQVSPFISLLLPAQDLSSYSLLQQQLLAVPLYSIILGNIPLHDGKQGNKTQEYDDYKLSPDAKDLFESYINARMPPGTSYAMTPSQDNTLFRFSEIPNANKIFLQGLQQLLANAGINGLLSTTDKPSVAQVNLSKKTETRFVDRLYTQYEHAINIQLSKMYYEGCTKYLWQFKIFGDIHSDESLEAAIIKDLSLGQKSLFPKFLALHGQTLNDAIGICDWIDSTEIYKKFEVLVNSFTSNTTNKIEKESGRPEANKDNIESDGTAASIDNGSNTGEMRKFIFEETCKCVTCEKEIIKKSETYPFCEDCQEIYLSEHIENNEELEE